MRKALATLKSHIDQVVQRWISTYTNARLESFNGLFQAARAKSPWISQHHHVHTMIYLIGRPVDSILKST